jgi:hypothetical protein
MQVFCTPVSASAAATALDQFNTFIGRDVKDRSCCNLPFA